MIDITCNNTIKSDILVYVSFYHHNIYPINKKRLKLI